MTACSVREGPFSCYTKELLAVSFRQELLTCLLLKIQGMILDFVGPCKYLTVRKESHALIEQLQSLGLGGEESDGESEVDSEFAFEDEYELDQISERVVEREFEQLSLNFSFVGNIFIDRVHYQGYSYVSRISNEPLNSNSLRVGISANINRIALSADHIYVRRVHFLESEMDASPDGSSWYELLLNVERPFSDVSIPVIM